MSPILPSALDSDIDDDPKFERRLPSSVPLEDEIETTEPPVAEELSWANPFTVQEIPAYASPTKKKKSKKTGVAAIGTI